MQIVAADRIKESTIRPTSGRFKLPPQLVRKEGEGGPPEKSRSFLLFSHFSRHHLAEKHLMVEEKQRAAKIHYEQLSA